MKRTFEQSEIEVIDLTTDASSNLSSSSDEEGEEMESKVCIKIEKGYENVIDLTSEDEMENWSQTITEFTIPDYNTLMGVYKHTDEMIIVDKAVTEKDDEVDMCNCAIECGFSCINVVMGVECNTLNCKLGYQCGNRWKDKMKPKLEVVYSKDLCYGLRSTCAIVEGTVVIEYVGEFMSVETYKQRVVCKSHTTTYAMETGDGYIIDARYYGNYARFINHDCNPNLVAIKRKMEITRVFLIALRDIEPFENVTFDYGNCAFKCLCMKCKLSSKV